MKKKRNIELSFSGGVIYCRCERYMTSIEERIKKADMLMYEAKRQGRNRILADDIESVAKIV